MRKGLTIFSTAVVTAVLTSALWIFSYNIFVRPADRPDARVALSADKASLDPAATTPVNVAGAVTVGPAGLAVPVAGVRVGDLVDTYTQARAGGGRLHDAIDILAPQGTPVVAATEGTVEKLFFSGGGGGITAYIRSNDGRWIYYYAHMQSYAPGLAEGQKVARGRRIGQVGSTGNANPAGPHLHFAIHRMSEGEKWWQGTPVNPFPLLAGQ